MADTRQLGALLVLAGGTLAIWAFGHQESTEKADVEGRITVVELDSTSSDVTVTVADVETATVTERRSYWLLKRGDTYSVDGTTLRLDGDCGWQCRADLVVTVPRGTKVTGATGSGDLSVTGVAGVDARSRSGDVRLRAVTGDVRLDLTSGDVSIDEVSGRLDVEGTSGDITAVNLRGGPVDLRTTSGDLEVELAEAGDVTVRGTSGDIRVAVPAAAYRIRTGTRTGDISDKLGDNPNGDHVIDAQTVSGDVELNSR